MKTSKNKTQGSIYAFLVSPPCSLLFIKIEKDFLKSDPSITFFFFSRFQSGKSYLYKKITNFYIKIHTKNLIKNTYTAKHT